MAEYIDDSGAYNQDALFSGTKETDYDYNETNEIVWFSGTGTCDTDFVLPDSAWILYEVYAPDSYTNSLSGGTTVQGKKEFTTTIGTIATTLSTWKTAFDAATSFTTYKVKATHYKGSDVADVYFADEGEGFSLTGGTEEGVTDGTFTGHGSEWVITDALLADGVTDASSLAEPVWVSFGTAGTAGTNTVNTITNLTDITTVYEPVDINGDASSVTLQLLHTWSSIKNGYDTDYCMTKLEAYRSFHYGTSSTSIDRDIKIYIPEGDFDVLISCIANTSETSDNFVTEYTLDGTMQSIDAQPATNSGGYCKTWNITSTGAYYTLSMSIATGGYNLRISSLRVTEV